MPFAGRDFLRVAESLAESKGDEASERSAISRAYYAVFHVARAYCDQTGTPVSRSTSAHGEIRRRFSHTGRITQDLVRLHVMRKNADYDIPYPAQDLTKQVQTALATAYQIITTIEELP